MIGRDYSGFNERCKVRDSHSVYTHTCYYWVLQQVLVLQFGLGQWPYFFGFPPLPYMAYFHEKLWAMIQSLPYSDIPTLGIALLSLIILLVLPKIPYINKVPAPNCSHDGCYSHTSYLSVSYRFDYR